MAKVSYAPEKEDIAKDALPENTTMFGYEFVGTKPVEVTNPAHLRKFAGHPHFKVSGQLPPASAIVRTAAERESAALGNDSQTAITGVAPVAPAVVPVQPQPQPPDKVTPGQADKPEGDSGLRAAHRGRGLYVVMDGDKDVDGAPTMNKDEAEDFNALSAEAKADFIAKAQK